jgi:hypothetical protein
MSSLRERLLKYVRRRLTPRPGERGHSVETTLLSTAVTERRRGLYREKTGHHQALPGFHVQSGRRIQEWHSWRGNHRRTRLIGRPVRLGARSHATPLNMSSTLIPHSLSSHLEI